MTLLRGNPEPLTTTATDAPRKHVMDVIQRTHAAALKEVEGMTVRELALSAAKKC